MQPTPVSPEHEQRSLAELLRELSAETGTLVRKEVALAKAEMSDKMSQVSSGIGSLVVGGAILLAGLIVLLDAAVIGLSNAFPSGLLWLSPLIIGLIVLIIGFAIVIKSRSNLKAANLAPQRTTSSLQRDKEFAKEQIR